MIVNRKGELLVLPDGVPTEPGDESAIIGKISPAALELKQFYRHAGRTLCFHPECADCHWDPTCQRSETIDTIGPGMNIRHAFRPQPGWILAAIDYKGIELRIAAEFSREMVWVNAFAQGGDPHTDMARKIYNVETPTKEQRKNAKVCNFSLLYLGTWYTIHVKTGDPPDACKEIAALWWKNVPDWEKWTWEQWSKAKKERGVRTHFKRWRPMDALIRQAEREQAEGKKGKKIGLTFARRTAVNMPVQGTSADIMKIAMVKVDQWIDKHKLRDRVHIITTVHDELVVEVKDDGHAEEYLRAIAVEMCLDMTTEGWIVPIETDIEVGYSWANVRPIDAFFASRPSSSKNKQASTSGGIDTNGEGSDDLVIYCEMLPTVANNDVVKVILQKAHILSSMSPETRRPVKVEFAGSMRTATIAKLCESVLRCVTVEHTGFRVLDLDVEVEPLARRPRAQSGAFVAG